MSYWEQLKSGYNRARDYVGRAVQSVFGGGNDSGGGWSIGGDYDRSGFQGNESDVPKLNEIKEHPTYPDDEDDDTGGGGGGTNIYTNRPPANYSQRLQEIRRKSHKQARKKIKPHYKKLIKNLAKRTKQKRREERLGFRQTKEGEEQGLRQSLERLSQQAKFGGQEKEFGIESAQAEEGEWRDMNIPELQRQLEETEQEQLQTGGLFTGKGRRDIQGAVDKRTASVEQVANATQRAISGEKMQYQQLMEDISRRKDVSQEQRDMAVRQAREELDLALTGIAELYRQKKQGLKWERAREIEGAGFREAQSRIQNYRARIGLT